MNPAESHLCPNFLTCAAPDYQKIITSSSTHRDHTSSPKVVENIGNPLSPYAVTKYVNELYADHFGKTYGFKTIGFRYFYIFGKRQDPNVAYTAVVPKWTSAMLINEDVFINGDGETSRDFCFIENAVKANLLSAVAKNDAKNQVYNIAVCERTSLSNLFEAIKTALAANGKYYDRSATF